MEKWDLTKLYDSEEKFENDIKKARAEILEPLSKLEGKLGTEEGLVQYLTLSIEADKLLSRLAEFASMRSDLDKKNVANASALAKVELLFNDFGAKVSYADPEILALGKEHIDAFFKKHPELNEFDFYFEKLFRDQDHVLSAKEERLMSNFSQLTGLGGSLYASLSISDYAPGKVKLSNGEEVEVNHSNWTNIVESLDKQDDRRLVFESLYSDFEKHKNTYGEIYNAVLQAELAEMKSRGYNSILEEHLYHNNIPTSVFHNLIEVASTENEALHRYYEIKRKYLGLEKFRSYDRFVQLAKTKKKYSYKEALELFYKSIESYPEDYQKKAREATGEGYVDVYAAPGKRSGAYSSGGSNIHPYILLNYEGGLEDVFTLAHESGHSVHTLYSMEGQPITKQNYTIFVAEIASTFNEHNLLDYLLEHSDLSKDDKIYLLQKSIDQICSTFYRQTLFGHYEYDIAKKVEAGEPINYEVLSNEMISLYKTYYGIDISEEKVKPLVWAYIPHLFRTPFYVYQYATSFTASMIIYEKVKKGEKGAWDNYLKMLSSGGSAYPIDEVKLGGADLTKKEAFLAVTERMKELVDQLEKLLAE